MKQIKNKKIYEEKIKMQIKNMVCLVRPQDLKNIALSIFLSLFIFKIVALDISTTGVCIPGYETNASRVGSVDNTYRNNLQTLFSNLTSSSLSFYNSTAGESPNKAYGLYLCRGDVSSSACRTCVKSITDPLASAIYDMCSKEGFVYADNDCMLHYANYSFFGTSNNSALLMLPEKLITRNYAEYNTTRVGVLNGVITDAANSTTLFATREAGVQGDGQEKVYALAQCTQDLDRDTCSGCLNAAFVDLTNTSGGVLKSAKAWLPSCQLRYDNVSFYGASPDNGASPATLNPPAVVSAFLVATWSLILIHLLLC